MSRAFKKITPRGWGKKSTESQSKTEKKRTTSHTLKTKDWKYSNIPEYQVQEYSNDGYDSGVRVKSAYILYIGLHSRR